MSPPAFDRPIAFVDVETTGGSAGRSRIIEIAVVGVAGGRLQFEWSSLVNPGVSIPPTIQHFTGITDEMVRCAPFFEDIAPDVAAHLNDRLFVAHNARFDYGFVRAELRRAGVAFRSPLACTVRLSRLLYPQAAHHDLDTVIERHGLSCAARHRALPDAAALWQLWQVLRSMHAAADLDAALALVTRLQSLPAHLPPNLADELPEAPGVYRFFGADDALLYVGKARNIRERVLGHWQSGVRDARSQRLAQLTQRIDWLRTAGELGALLLEARLIREQRPLYNQRLRGSTHAWTWCIGNDGGAPRLAPLDHVQLSFDGCDTYGVFRSAAAARKVLEGAAREQGLCLKMLGLESAAGSCFAYQLGRCAGACVGTEPLLRHGVRVKLALASLRLKNWPFAGAVGVRERSWDGRTQLHVLDDWRHIVTLDTDVPVAELRSGRAGSFDLDVYRILHGHFTRARRLDLVRLEGLPLRSEDVA